MRNRYYDPGTGRFTQRDPIGLGGGLNLYGFAEGDPVNYSDPFGLSPLGLFAKTVKLAFKRISREQALSTAEDVFVAGRSASGDAKKLAREKWGSRAVRHDAHQEGQLPHYQHKNGGRGHIFYLEKLGTLGVATFGDNVVGQAVDFLNPASDALAAYELYEMAKDEIRKHQERKSDKKPEERQHP